MNLKKQEVQILWFKFGEWVTEYEIRVMCIWMHLQTILYYNYIYDMIL